MIAIIDYDAGNIKSVEKAIQFLGEEAVITRESDLILTADKVILPGVGAFGDAMNKIRRYGLEEVIMKVAGKGIPFLGICLGLQLLFEESEESSGIQGLCLLKGKIRRIPEGAGIKVPHIGWNSISLPGKSRLFAGIKEETFVYFVHSYYLCAQKEEIVTAVTQYNTLIHAAVEEDNLYGCQFHPEKSSDAGIKILENFLRL